MMGLGVLSSLAHCSTVRVGTVPVSRDCHTFMVLSVSAGVPNLTYGTTGPTGWSFKCVEAWDSTLVHLAKVVLVFRNLICCFKIYICVYIYYVCMYICIRIHIGSAKKFLRFLRKIKDTFFIFTENFIEQHIHPFVPPPLFFQGVVAGGTIMNSSKEIVKHLPVISFRHFEIQIRYHYSCYI